MTSTAKALKPLVLLLAAATFCSAVFAATAPAATTLGSKCVANGAPAGAASVDTASTSPISGVITNWGFGFPAAPPTYPTFLMVLSPDGGGGFSIVAVDGPLQAQTGVTTKAVRIPINAGQSIGSWGSAGTLICSGPGSSNFYPLAAQPVPGGTLTTPAPLFGVPALYADVEPDVDGDGFGDETQDFCTLSPQVQTACPVPSVSFLRLPSATGLKGLVTASVASSTRATGSVKLPASKGKRSRTLTFRSKSVKTDLAKISKISLNWPRALNSALKNLSKRKRLKVSVTIEATATAGGLKGSKKLTIKLPGRK